MHKETRVPTLSEYYHSILRDHPALTYIAIDARYPLGCYVIDHSPDSHKPAYSATELLTIGETGTQWSFVELHHNGELLAERVKTDIFEVIRELQISPISPTNNWVLFFHQLEALCLDYDIDTDTVTSTTGDVIDAATRETIATMTTRFTASEHCHDIMCGAMHSKPCEKCNHYYFLWERKCHDCFTTSTTLIGK